MNILQKHVHFVCNKPYRRTLVGYSCWYFGIIMRLIFVKMSFPIHWSQLWELEANCRFVLPMLFFLEPAAVARSEASLLGMQAAPSSIPTSGTFFRGDLVIKTFLRPFSLFRCFKKSSCQLMEKECALSTGKLPRRLAQEQCG